MLFNTLMYTLPAIYMVVAGFILFYRTVVLDLIGQESNKLVFSIAILFFVLSILGFVLIITGNIDILLIWMIVSLTIFLTIIYFLYYLYQQTKK